MSKTLAIPQQGLPFNLPFITYLQMLTAKKLNQVRNNWKNVYQILVGVSTGMPTFSYLELC